MWFTKKKCGICKELVHNRKTCPQLPQSKPALQVSQVKRDTNKITSDRSSNKPSNATNKSPTWSILPTTTTNKLATWRIIRGTNTDNSSNWSILGNTPKFPSSSSTTQIQQKAWTSTQKMTCLEAMTLIMIFLKLHPLCLGLSYVFCSFLLFRTCTSFFIFQI